jgi:hypothetical protein
MCFPKFESRQTWNRNIRLARLLLRLPQAVLSNLPSVDKGKPSGKSK